MDRTQQHRHQLGTARHQANRSQPEINHTTNDYLTAIVIPAFAWVAVMLAMMGGVL